MDSLQKGWPGAQPADRFSYDLNPSAFWGFIENNQTVINALYTAGVDWYFWDMPYYGRWMPNTKTEFHWRGCKNSIHYKKTHNYPGDRFAQWNVKLEPKCSGDKILICPSSETITRWYTGVGVKQWIENTVEELKKHTDRPIEIRPKPRNAKTSGPAAATIPFSVQAQNSYCVITCASISAVEAQLLGILTISDPNSFAAEVSNTKLSNIENLTEFDPTQWFYNLAYSQFTHSEIENGLAREIINDS
jgi:hypothetical protein